MRKVNEIDMTGILFAVTEAHMINECGRCEEEYVTIPEEDEDGLCGLCTMEVAREYKDSYGVEGYMLPEEVE